MGQLDISAGVISIQMVLKARRLGQVETEKMNDPGTSPASGYAKHL